MKITIMMLNLSLHPKEILPLHHREGSLCQGIVQGQMLEVEVGAEVARQE